MPEEQKKHLRVRKPQNSFQNDFVSLYEELHVFIGSFWKFEAENCIALTVIHVLIFQNHGQPSTGSLRNNCCK